MLMPKRTKYRRPHRVSYEGKAKGGKTIAFGEFGLQWQRKVLGLQQIKSKQLVSQ